jgi:hypothetical protein
MPDRLEMGRILGDLSAAAFSFNLYSRAFVK